MDATRARRAAPAILSGSLAALTALCASLFAGSAAAETLAGNPMSRVVPSAVRVQATTSRHLYVLDTIARAVLRYPLTAGLPAQAPDAILTGFSRPLGITVGQNDGRLYVVDEGKAQLDIYDPAPGSGSQPSRILSLEKLAKLGRGHGLGAVAVDQSGLVYIGYLTVSCADVCSTSAHVAVYAALPSGKQAPFRHLDFSRAPRLAQVSVYARQEIAASWPEVAGPFVAADVPEHLAEFSQSFSSAYHFAIAWDPANRLYVSDFGEKGSSAANPPVPVQVEVVPNWRDCQYAVYGKGCSGEYGIYSTTVPLAQPRGVAYDGGFLYVTSAFDSRIGSALVFVFDPMQGAQTPKAILGGRSTQLKSAHNIAVGP